VVLEPAGRAEQDGLAAVVDEQIRPHGVGVDLVEFGDCGVVCRPAHFLG
jgi:hypothetical protein